MPYKHVVVTEFGGPDKLMVVEEPNLPEPGPHEVRVKVLAAGTGFTDTIIRQGQYVEVKDNPPFTLGYDWFGVVDKLGEEVTSLSLGQFVADLSVIGGYTEYLCVDASSPVVAPVGLDPAEAVAMVLSYTTAYQMLTREKQLQAGMTCLVHAAGGAVGSALLELGRLMGLHMIGTASASKKALVEGFGTSHIDYRNEDFVERTLEISDGGVDIVFDTVGARSWSRSYRCLKPAGKLVAFGALQVTTGQESVPRLLMGFGQLLVLWRLMPDGKASSFYNIHSRRKKHPQEFKQDLQHLLQLLKRGDLKPAIADRLPLQQAAEAHRRIDRADVNGKIVLVNELN